jgi:polyisoprenoid-binding protein YceI
MMTKLIYPVLLLALFASCQDAPEGDQAKVADTQEAAAATGGNTYTVDTQNSAVTFVGTKPTGTHTGEMKLSSGTFNVDNGNITSGTFTIDMTKIVSKDADTNYSFKLIGHLQSPDFFDVAKFPGSKFEVTACTPLTNDSMATHAISGNLTLKDSTKNVTFPAKVAITETGLSATADFIIDRTQWGLFYGNDKSLGDKFIYPEVKLQLNIQAKK